MTKEPIKNIIFDLGGVILNIDYNLTVEAFRNLGFEDFDLMYSKAKQSGLFDNYEKGFISEGEFVNQIKRLGDIDLKDEEVINAWNAMLLDFPVERLEFIDSLRNDFKVFLLSNTNHTHQMAFEEILKREVGLKSLSAHFDVVYYSHKIGMRKPDTEIFQHVLSENNLKNQQTFFIDDSIQHVKGAVDAGIRGSHLEGEDMISHMRRII